MGKVSWSRSGRRDVPTKLRPGLGSIALIALTFAGVLLLAECGFLMFSIGTVETPTFSMSEGTYSGDIKVAISCLTAGADIYYTTDGGTPTHSTAKYAGPISVAGDGTKMTIKTIGAKRGMDDSMMAQATYVISYSTVSTPQFSPPEGTYTSDQMVTITCDTEGAAIYYTTDLSDPTTSSIEYHAPISVAGNGKTVIQAIAAREGMYTSTASSASYVIAYPASLTVTAALGGSTSPSGTQTVMPGTVTPILATPDSGYGFAVWTVTSGTGVGIDYPYHNSTTVTLTGWPGTVQANFGYVFSWTEQTPPDTGKWMAIASSSDGTRLATCNGYDYAETKMWTGVFEGGNWTWTYQAATGSRYWVSIASSADGLKLAACVLAGDIWTGTYEAGSWTWTDQAAAGSRNWVSIASSADGLKLAACPVIGDIWTSTDGGVTWTDQAAAGSRNWVSIASSADGLKLAASASASVSATDGDIWTSADGGVTWTEQVAAGSGNLASIASSSDGTKLAACSSVGDVWIGTLEGGSWTWTTHPIHDPNHPSVKPMLRTVASSADGMKLAAADPHYGDIWTSLDGGTSWMRQAPTQKLWWDLTCIASSADGKKLAASDWGGVVIGQWE